MTYTHITAAIAKECQRVRSLLEDGTLMVEEEDGTLRPFLKCSDQPVLGEWDRVCYKDGRVWVEAWPYGAIRPTSNAQPRYLHFRREGHEQEGTA